MASVYTNELSNNISKIKMQVMKKIVKTFRTVVITVLLATVLCSTASAHHYICEYCGSGANASNMPQPRNSCQRNPHGKVHSWVMDIEDSRSHRCICAYCGAGVTSAHMPQPGNSCYRNPEGGKYHRWIQKD